MRRSRLELRGRADLLPNVEKHSTEIDVISRLPELADLKLDSEGRTPEALADVILSNLKQE